MRTRPGRGHSERERVIRQGVRTSQEKAACERTEKLEKRIISARVQIGNSGMNNILYRYCEDRWWAGQQASCNPNQTTGTVGPPGWRVWLSLFVMTDQNWALSVRDMNRGGPDAAYLLGSGLPMWGVWVVTSAVGHVAGQALRPPPGHPLFFAAIAVFVSMLAGMWRGRRDLVPWGVAALVSTAVAWLLPGTFWYIVAGAVAGSATGALRDRAADAR